MEYERHGFKYEFRLTTESTEDTEKDDLQIDKAIELLNPTGH